MKRVSDVLFIKILERLVLPCSRSVDRLNTAHSVDPLHQQVAENTQHPQELHEHEPNDLSNWGHCIRKFQCGCTT